MSFKLGRFFYCAVSFIMGSFFFVVGIFILALPWSSSLRTIATKFITENTTVFSLFGLGFALMGLSIGIYAFLRTRHRYVQILIKHNSFTLDETMIRQYLEAYWHKQFPQSQTFFDLTLKKQAIQIAADLPFIPIAEQHEILEQIKDDFSDLFGRVLGYPYDVHLIASFRQHV